jgi:hypothetical protein
MEFHKAFVKTGRINRLRDLASANIEELRGVWRNRRSWSMAKEIAAHLATLSDDDVTALRKWAKNAKIESWRQDPIGRVKGVGLVTYQYLRMMGGVDTVMPDKIVKRVINGILEKAGLMPIHDDMNFIRKTEEIAKACGYRPIELCWMTWFIQSEGNRMRMEKYAGILSQISLCPFSTYILPFVVLLRVFGKAGYPWAVMFLC